MNFSRWADYLWDMRSWKAAGGQIDRLRPILGDKSGSAGDFDQQYFIQDLWVAQSLFGRQPQRHLDVGSSLYGFVSHVATFMEIEVVDIRPHPIVSRNIHFIQSSLIDFSPSSAYDSVTSLHALEHFGLGRYGDAIDPRGHLRGFSKLVEVTSEGGTLVVSFPIATRSRIEFNAHRVLSPDEIVTWPGAESLELVQFDWIDEMGHLHENESLSPSKDIQYGCGIYTFRKFTTTAPL